MIQAIRDFFTLPARFKKLQADHDLRSVLNGRLQRHCDLQRKEIKRLTGIKTRKGSHEETKALRHIRHMRGEVQRRMLAALLPLSVVIEIQNKVEHMTDEEIMAYRAPKREVASCSQK